MVTSLLCDFGCTLLLLLLLLSRFSRVQLCATPQTAAHKAPPSLGFSRQEHWSGLPFPSPMHESESESEVTQSCPTLRDPMDCSLQGSSVHVIFQARVLESGAIAFSVLKPYPLKYSPSSGEQPQLLIQGYEQSFFFVYPNTCGVLFFTVFVSSFFFFKDVNVSCPS